MKIAVVGMWHLGTVTAACVANVGFKVVAFDSNKETIESLKQGKTPIFEPELDSLIRKNIDNQMLNFTSVYEDIGVADIVWVTLDTPVDSQDVADVTAIFTEVVQILPYIKPSAIVLVSSQIPVGTTRKLLHYCQETYPEKQLTFACSPENLRLGKAIQVFQNPERIIVGLFSDASKEKIATLFQPFTENILWMSIESAEMTKHAINAFLATSVVFINELATLCERVGADARDVELGLKSEERIGPKAYLRPGAAITGGTLARDVNFLTQMGAQHDLKTPLFSSLLESNYHHKQWSCWRVKDVLNNLHNKTVTVLGLAYKVGTNTLRRSGAIETCTWLRNQGVNVLAYDPSIQELPGELNDIVTLKASLDESYQDSDAIIITTECPEFLALTSEGLLRSMREPNVFDASAYLIKQIGNHEHIHYYTVGVKHEAYRA